VGSVVGNSAPNNRASFAGWRSPGGDSLITNLWRNLALLDNFWWKFRLLGGYLLSNQLLEIKEVKNSLNHQHTLHIEREMEVQCGVKEAFFFFFGSSFYNATISTTTHFEK
jgi:hypothetical protein